MTMTRFTIIPFALGLAACTVGPDYQPPKEQLATRFAEGTTNPVAVAGAQYWWRAFNDPILDDLVQTGLAQNLDIKSALARVAEAQAAARASGLPALVDGSISANITRSGEEGIAADTSRSASFSPSVILDLFGGERRSRERALAELRSAELSVGTAQLVYLSALTSSYIDMRYYQEAIALTRQTVDSRRETLSLVQRQRESGSVTELDVAQAQASLDEALATLPTSESGYYGSTYAIATLLAQPVQTIAARLQRGAAQPRPGGRSDVGVPADLLRNRPDIRAAERNYAAAVAAIGVSEAQLYPSLSLGGTITASDNDSWSFGAALVMPVLAQGVLRARRDQAVAQADQAKLNWRASVLGAVEDVQAAQSDYIRNRRAVAAYRRSVESYARVVDLSRQTFNAGTTTLIDLLENQRSLSNSKLSLAAGMRNLAASWATLQVSAGVGWQLPATDDGA